MQSLDILFDGINELCLVFLDGSANLNDHLATRHDIMNFRLVPLGEQKGR